MNKLSATTVSIIIGLLTTIGIFITRCNNNPTPTTTGNDIIQQVFDQQFVDSLLDVNRDLRREKDSLTVELGIALINIPDDKETQTVTQIIRKFVYKDTFETTVAHNEVLQNQLDSLTKQTVMLINEYERNNQTQREALEQAFKNKIKEAVELPRTINYHNDYVSVNAIASPTEQMVLVSGVDTLNVTHKIEKSWFLGRKKYYVLVDNTNPHITTTGTTYVIDKKLQRQARRTLRKKQRQSKDKNDD